MSQVDWTDGYITRVDYTMGYYAELNPVRAAYALLTDGYGPPPDGPCCELGFGQGLSIAFHAVASADRTWWGTDFNPSQALHAGGLIAAAGTHAHIEEQSFAEFCARDDLPQFAFVGLHGIWSWISDENRALLVDFLRRKLMTGGVAYVSYNTFPGWAAMAPVRHLMMEHSRWMSAPGISDTQRMSAAFDYMGQLIELDPATVRANPQIKSRIAEMRSHPAEYLVHEYLNADWRPMAFSEVAEQLHQAKLSFACSAHLQDRMPGIQLTAPQQAFLARIDHAGFRQSTRDMFVNQQFRRDLWVRGARRLVSSEQLQLLRKTRVVLGMHPSDVPISVKGVVGEATLNRDRVDRVLAVVSAAAGAIDMAHLFDELAGQGIPFEATQSVVSILVSLGALHAAVSDDQARAARPATDRLNAALLERATARSDIAFLVSPLTGGGVAVPPMVQAVLARALAAPHDGPQAWADAVQRATLASGRHVTKDGQAVTDPRQSMDMLLPIAQAVQDKWLALLRRLQVIA